jgi:uncharacterized Tic20 family protein
MTEIEHASLTTQDERVMAGLAHLSALIPMMGMIAPIVIWVTQKENSKYVAFQSLQALAYQITMVIASFIGWACYGISFFGIFFTIPFAATPGSTEQVSPLAIVPALFPFLTFGLIFFSGFILIGYAIYGGVRAFMGKPFRYLLVGNWVDRYLNPQKKQEA